MREGRYGERGMTNGDRREWLESEEVITDGKTEVEALQRSSGTRRKNGEIITGVCSILNETATPG